MSCSKESTQSKGSYLDELAPIVRDDEDAKVRFLEKDKRISFIEWKKKDYIDIALGHDVFKRVTKEKLEKTIYEIEGTDIDLIIGIAAVIADKIVKKWERK